MRIPDESTVSELKKRRGWYGSLEAVRSVHSIEPSKGTLSRIVRGQGISVQAENAVRRAFGMEPWGIEVPPCPDCGSVHLGRCHGLPVASVVVLQPGDVVQHNNGSDSQDKHKPVKPRAPSKDIRIKPNTYDRLSLLKEGGQTWDDLQNEMARVYEEHKRRP